MIRRTRAALAALLLLGLAGCNDELLTEVPQDFIGPDNFFRNADDAVAAVNGVYASFITPLGCGSDDYYGRNFPMLVEYPGEALTSRYGATHDRGGIDALNITTEHAYLATSWKCAYSAIASANAVVVNVPGITAMDPAFRDRVVAEARFLRATHYFNLVRLFGDVPLRLEPVTTLENLAMPRSPAADVYAAVISDLEFAVEKLPASYAGVAGENTGRATSGAARTLLGKVYLQHAAVHGGGAASYQKAIEQLRQVVASGRYQLLPDFGRVFALDNEMNAEVIFAVQNTRVSGLGGRLGQHVAPINSFLNGVNAGGISFYPEWPFYRDWSDQDERKSGTFSTRYVHPTHGLITWSRPGMTTAQLNNFGTPGGGPYITKYLDPEGVTGAGDENDYILLRYADALLMLAEAINEASGPTGEAYAAVNAVRDRAGLADLPEGLSQEQFRNAVQLERRHELVLEFHTYFDMQRHWAWSKARVEANIQAGRPVSAGGQNLNGSPWGNSVPKVGLSGGVVEDKYRFFPIPAAAIRSNPELVQNPGWQ
ncbi:MAG TPA: RagB/SusD family nutrient uptake outer membrane protein [Longimicrobiaceae bacterium]|nr:RagB/SusD family nutrient uptake outer membrane protein [Longimicrobiaceae bacterium]